VIFKTEICGEANDCADLLRKAVTVEMDGRLFDYEDADNGSSTSDRLFSGSFTSVETSTESSHSAGHCFNMADMIGLPPQQSAFFIHATIVQQYWNGAYRPSSGAQRISDAVVAIINENGGETLKARQASQLLFNQGRVIGVCAHKTNHPEESREFFAPIVIPDARRKSVLGIFETRV
jgi:phytoene dehydrogenase-like protein